MATTNLPPSLESVAKTVRAMLAKHEEELREHRDQIRQIFRRLEQNDAAIRRILDRLERRLADDGGRPAA